MRCCAQGQGARLDPQGLPKCCSVSLLGLGPSPGAAHTGFPSIISSNLKYRRFSAQCRSTSGGTEAIKDFQ